MNKDKRLKLFLQYKECIYKREFYKDITVERNNRKKYHIDGKTDSNEVFAMFDKIESETESDIENLLEDSGTEYIVEEPISDNKEESHQLLTPEATVPVEGGVMNIDEPAATKRKKNIAKLK